MLFSVYVIYFKFYLFLTVLGLRCCVGFLSSCGEQGLFSSCDVQASHFHGFSLLSIDGLSGARALVVAGQGVSSCSF